jgi:hypothetical protein
MDDERQARLLAIAKALAWEWLIEGNDAERDSWLEKAAAVADLTSHEAVARKLCKLNNNCWGYREGKLTDLCPTDAACNCWAQWETSANAVLTAGQREP